jgi:hypothetical protein
LNLIAVACDFHCGFFTAVDTLRIACGRRNEFGSMAHCNNLGIDEDQEFIKPVDMDFRPSRRGTVAVLYDEACLPSWLGYLES